MDENKRYKLFKLFLIFTILNLIGIFLYENIGKMVMFKKKPEFYIESIKSESKDGNKKEDKEKNKDEHKNVKETGMQPAEEKKADKPENNEISEVKGKRVLVIGDSNAYLMSQNEKKYDKEYEGKIYWLAESGANVGFISKGLKVKLGMFKPEYMKNTLTNTGNIDLLKEIKEKNITDIAVILGVNSLGENSAKELSKKLIKLSEDSSAKVSYVSILPYVNKSKYKIQNNDVIKFNSMMKKNLSGSNIGYVNAYGKIASLEGYKGETDDGLHYSGEIYDKVFEKIMETIVQNN